MAYKVFSNGDALTGGELNTYLMNQSVIQFASTTARDAAIPAPSEGQLVWLQDSNKYVYYTGSAWSDLITPAPSGNAIINGAFDIWQRGTAAVTTSTYSADRWSFYGQGSGTSHSATRQTFTPGTAPVAGYESEFFYQDVITSGSDANTQLLMLQKIEDVRKFAGETVTMSFWAKATSGTPKIGAELYQDFGSGGSSAVAGTGQSATISTSWARYSFTFAVPSISGKTIGTGSSLYANIWFSAGSTWNARSGSVGLQSATFQVWGVQVESGSTATAFKRNASNIQGELAACQRYYWRVDSTNNSFAVYGSGLARSSTTALMQLNLPVTMRINPLSVDYSSNLRLQSGNAGIAVTGVTLSANEQTLNLATIAITVASGLTTSQYYLFGASGSTSTYVGISAEL